MDQKSLEVNYRPLNSVKMNPEHPEQSRKLGTDADKHRGYKCRYEQILKYSGSLKQLQGMAVVVAQVEAHRTTNREVLDSNPGHSPNILCALQAKESTFSDPDMRCLSFSDKMAAPPQHASRCNQILGSNLEQTSEMAFWNKRSKAWGAVHMEQRQRQRFSPGCPGFDIQHLQRIISFTVAKIYQWHCTALKEKLNVKSLAFQPGRPLDQFEFDSSIKYQNTHVPALTELILQNVTSNTWSDRLKIPRLQQISEQVECRIKLLLLKLRH